MLETQKYDETAIRLAGNFAESFFKDFDNYKNQYKPSELFTGLEFDIIKKRNALDNYILKYYSSLDVNSPDDLLIKNNMDKYLRVLYKKIVSRPNELLGSPFLKSPKVVDTFCPEEIEMNGENVNLREKVKEIYRENTKNPKELYDRDRDFDNLSKEENDRLMHSLILKIGTDDKKIQAYQEEYLKKLISKKIKVKDLNPKQVEFIAKYINNLMLESRLKELGHHRDDIQEYIYIGEARSQLGGFENDKNIYINKNSHLTEDIPSLIQVVCHETEHSIQDFVAKQNLNSKIGLDSAISSILRNYYDSEKGYDVYNNNYRFEEIEKDAEKEGSTYAIIYLNMLGFNDEADKLRDIKLKKSDSRRFEYDFRIDENGKKTTREVFLFNSLNNAIAKRPDLIKNYPSLSLLYKDNGKVKSFEEIISGDFKINDQSKSVILEDFCKYYISKNELEKLDLSKFPEDVQTNIASRLISILGTESSQITKMGIESKQYHYGDINEEDKRGVERFHLKISKNIMKFMNKNYNHFMELQNSGKFSSIINMENYDSVASNFKFDSKYENLVYNVPEHIEEVKHLAIEAEKNKIDYRNRKNKKFTVNHLESSFDSLVNNSKTTGFQQASEAIQILTKGTVLENEQEMEKQ